MFFLLIIIILSTLNYTKSDSKLNLKKVVDHYVGDLNNDTRSFSYVVFADPQLGFYDNTQGELGTKWQHDLDNLKRFSVAVNELKSKPDFIVCLGDLINAYPTDGETPKKEGFLSAYRPAQTLDFMESLNKNFDNDIPIFMIAGNHDLSPNPTPVEVDAYEKVWGDTYYYFWNAGHIFISFETQFFRSELNETVVLREKELKWLTSILEKLDVNAIKTVFQHVPMFIENANETDSEVALPKKYRMELLELYCKNNIQTVFSGHTHFHAFPDNYKCPDSDDRVVEQVIVTSLTGPAEWKSDSNKTYPIDKPGYLIAKVDEKRKMDWEMVELKVEEELDVGKAISSLKTVNSVGISNET